MSAPLPPLPARFVARLERDLGADGAGRLVAALARDPERGLRLNPRRLDADALVAATGWALEPLPWTPDGFRLRSTGGESAGKHPLHEAGAYYLQDPSAMAVAETLRAPLTAAPNPWVLDLAAAPGGKATHLAGLLGGRGVLVANDVHPGRVTELGRNLERWGASNALVMQVAPADLAAAWGAAFDAVLLDAPCSGEGMFRKSSDARAMWNHDTVLACAARQSELLDAAAALVAPGGHLVYSTCTFAPEENERAVLGLLRRHPAFEIDALDLPGTDPGRPDLASDDADPERAATLAGTARLWPHRHPGEGHFVARLVRRGGDPAPRPVATPERGPDEADEALWRAFVTEALTRDPVAGWPLEVRGERLVARPPGPPLGGLATLRRGLPLGRIKRGRRRGAARFEPSHALTHALAPGDVQRRLELAPDDPRAASYLVGLELDAPGDDGWLVVTTLGCPLGWGVRKRGRTRNAYPKGLRLR